MKYSVLLNILSNNNNNKKNYIFFLNVVRSQISITCPESNLIKPAVFAACIMLLKENLKNMKNITK